MERRTKIVCTLGPASNTKAVISALIAAGMDVARLNFSHGTHAGHQETILRVREAAREAGRVIPILQDLQGPKIRIGQVKNNGVLLHVGQDFALTAGPVDMGTARRVHVSYPSLAADVKVGGTILIDDGNIELEVVQATPESVVTRVVVGGILRSRKGVNLPDIKTTAPALTDKDLKDLEFGLSMDVDMLALSFVRSGQDVGDLIQRVRKSGKNVMVLAKIEKPEAVNAFDRILSKADGIMVARGDLGIEMPLSQVPVTQKMIIKKCMNAAKPVITATQMLESMIHSPRPTRAEASDVANAVLDGSDAVMLSGETAAGEHPVRVVEVMDRIICRAEVEGRPYQHPAAHPPGDLTREEQVTPAISYIASELARQVGAKAIVCLTHSGSTARRIASFRPDVPIYAFTDDPRMVPQLALTWGTNAFHIPFQKDTDAGVQLVHKSLIEAGVAQRGDRIVITAGMPLPKMGRSNMVHVSQL